MKRKITFFQNFHWDFTTSCFTWKNVSSSFYVSIRQGRYRMSQKSKIDTSFDVSNHFFLNWLFSWEFGKEIFHKIGKKSETKNSLFKKELSRFKIQIISFLNLKHIMESGGVPVMLNLVFYVLKVKQLKRIPLLISIHQIFLIS